MGKKKNKKVPPPEQSAQTALVLSGKPLIMNQTPYQTLEKYQKDLSSSERKVLLSVSDYHLSSINPGHMEGENVRTHMLVFCIRFLEKDICYTIGAINFDKNGGSNEDFTRTLASIFKYFIIDLKSLNLTVVCSISPPDKLYTDTIKLLAQKSDFEKSSHPIIYSVTPVMDIVHLYDLYELMMSLQKMFRFHNEMYYLVYEYKEGLRRCHSYWSDVLAVMTLTEYNCNYIASRISGTPVANIFNLAFYYTVIQAQESGKLMKTPSMNDTIRLFDTLCPMVQSIFHLSSVSSSDLEELYDSLEDVRIILSSIVFRKTDDLSSSLMYLTSSDLPRPPTSLSVSSNPAISDTPTTSAEEEIPTPGFSKEKVTGDPDKPEFRDCEVAYKEFVEHMAYDGSRLAPADGGEAMKSKRKRYAEQISKTVKQQFDNYLKSLSDVKTKRRGKGRKSHGAAEIVIDPQSLKPQTIEASKVQKEVKEEQEETKTKKNEKKSKKKSKKISKSSTSEEIVSIKPSTSGDSLSKPSTSVTSASKPSTSADSISKPSTSVTSASKSSTSAASVSKPSTSAASGSKPSTSTASVSKPSTSTASVSEPSTSAASGSKPPTSITEQEKPHHTRPRHKPYKNKKRFYKLHVELPNNIEHERAPLNCLCTIKAFVKLADILRKHKISNIMTNVFCLEHIDFYLKENMKRDKADQGMEPEESHCALHYNILEYNSISDIVVNDITRILQTLEITEEDVVEDTSDNIGHDVIQIPQTLEIMQEDVVEDISDIVVHDVVQDPQRLEIAQDVVEDISDIAVHDVIQNPQTLEITQEDIVEEEDLEDYLDQEFKL